MLTDDDIRDALEAEFLGEPGNRNLADDLRVARAAIAAHEAKAAPADGRGTDAQIQKERDIARHAIVGALAAGYAGQAHPGADHWLAAAHDAGVRIKSLELKAPAPAVPEKLPSGMATSQDGGKWRVTLEFDAHSDAAALHDYMLRNGVPAKSMVTAPAVPQGEPVAWRVSSKDEPELGFWLDEEGPSDDDMGLHYEPLYTTPAAPSQPVPFDQWNSSPYTQVLHETIKDLSQKLASMTQSQPAVPRGEIVALSARLTDKEKDKLYSRMRIIFGQINQIEHKYGVGGAAFENVQAQLESVCRDFGLPNLPSFLMSLPITWVKYGQVIEPRDPRSPYFYDSPTNTKPVPKPAQDVTLTDEDVLRCAALTLGEQHVENCGLGDIKEFARAIIAALREKGAK